MLLKSAIFLLLVIQTVVARKEGVEDYEGNSSLIFKAISQEYMNISCKNCFKIDFHQIVAVEVKTKQSGQTKYQGKDRLLKSEGLDENIEIQVSLTPCQTNNIMFIVHFVDDKGIRQQKQKTIPSARKDLR